VTTHVNTSSAIRSVRETPEEDVSFLGIANVLLRHRRLVVGWTLLVFTAVVGFTVFAPRTFTTRSSFMPQARKQTGGLSGLAANLGVLLPTLDGGQSPAFYADLLESRSILGAVVDSSITYRTNGGEARVNLIDFYRSKGATPLRRRDAAIRSLAEDIEAGTVQRTGVVNLEVTMTQPGLALEVSRRLIDLVNQFNLRTRQSQAREERRFTETRLAEVRRDLRAAEDRLETFLQRNRDTRNSPQLMFQTDRLQRDVSMQQQLYTTLAEAYEQVKIEEVRDTPVITVVQHPELPARPDPRGLIGKGILGLLAGLFLGAGLAIWKSYAANSERSGTSAAAEFAVLRQQALGDLVQPWRPVAQLLGLARRRPGH
jgi:uncharacterized protein involved in exopolysaccharide biosynthesis